TGGKGKGCIFEPDPLNPVTTHSGPAMDLGKGWKVRPFISVRSLETVTLADIQGPGCINEIFLTSDLREFRALVLRIYWDHEKTASVETPMGDFFAIGHDHAPNTVYSLPITVAPYRGCNSYWQMPFRTHCRITLENQGPKNANVGAYRVLYKLLYVPEDTAYFHAQWRRSLTRKENPEHIILSGVRGRGLYVGTYLAQVALSQ